MKELYSQVEYQIIIKTKRNKSTLGFRVQGHPLYTDQMSLQEKALIYQELRWAYKAIRKVYRRAIFKNSKLHHFTHKLKTLFKHESIRCR